MIESILAATDGSQHAQASLGWAARLARMVSADLSVVGVESAGQAEVSPEVFDERAREFAVRLGEWIAAADVGDVHAVPLFRQGRPADVIEAEIERSSPDLVVVGARGGGGFTHLGLGSTTHQLAHRTTTPLAAVHQRHDLGAETQLVVGVDGSPGSKLALLWALELSPFLSVPPVAVFVHDALADSYPHPANQTWKYQGQTDAERCVEEVRGRQGVELELLVESGNAVDRLAEVAERFDSAILAVGTRSHGLVPERLLGRVPMELLHHCEQPVVLVPFHK